MTTKNSYQSVRKVLWGVLLANLLITVVKIGLGLLTGALAVVADGFHSLVDTSSNLVGLAAIRLADRPADERHPYGYARYETLGSLIIGGMLLVAAYEISSSIIQRIGGGSVPKITPLTFSLIALTFPVNVLIVYLETRAGKKLNSEILIADATHTRTDLFVTASVLASLIGVWVGWPWLDQLVAAGVVVLILRAAFTILRSTASWLTDASILDAAEIETEALHVPGVWYVHRARSRGAPAAVFVDLHVKVYPGMSTDQAHAIATEVERRIKQRFPQVAEILVHIEPGKLNPSLAQGAAKSYQDYLQITYDLRKIADGLGVGVHDIHVNQDEKGHLDIEAHLEIRGDQTLDEAHDLADKFELRVRYQWPNATSIITHLEPLPEEILQPGGSVDQLLQANVEKYLHKMYTSEQVLEIHTHQLNGHRSVAIRLGLPGSLHLADAHAQAEKIERDLLNQFEALYRVTVHVEPKEN
jgi:cation diffusion facilitator family transporter